MTPSHFGLRATNSGSLCHGRSLEQLADMPPKIRMRLRKGKPTWERLDPFARGMIWGMHRADASRADIVAEVKKSDGTSVGQRAVDNVIAHMTRDPSWRGAETGKGDGRGRPPSLSDADRKAIQKVVSDNNAKAWVTANYIRKVLKHLRRFIRWCICRALEQAGLAWLQRRIKRVRTVEHRAGRITYSNWVEEKRQNFLKRYGYTDGTTIYLARTWEEHDWGSI